MSAQPAPVGPQPLAARRAENREHYRDILRRVIDHGAVIVEALDPAFTDPIAAAAAYHDVARAIRQGIMLADKLAEPIPEPREPSQTAAPEPGRNPSVHQRQDATGQTRSEPPEPLEALERERMEAPEPAEQLPDRSVEDIILGIRRALGLLPTAWPHRTVPTFEPRAALADLAARPPACDREGDDDGPRPARRLTFPDVIDSS